MTSTTGVSGVTHVLSTGTRNQNAFRATYQYIPGRKGIKPKTISRNPPRSPIPGPSRSCFSSFIFYFDATSSSFTRVSIFDADTSPPRNRPIAFRYIEEVLASA